MLQLDSRLLAFSLLLAPAAVLFFAVVVPNEVQQPGTQPGEATLESVNRCDNCHGGYDPAVEPARGWNGSLMSHASRDPLFWAAVAVAEQDFDGAGDLCLRCHVPLGWVEGRSTPTDGSGFQQADAEGVTCDLCHQMVRPDESEHPGIQNAPFLAHDEGSPATSYFGSAMFVVTSLADKLGPYDSTVARHGFRGSDFHRSEDQCATCHDVSNPVTGDLAHNNGAQVPLTGGFSGVPGSPVDGKAAFNHFPFEYGVIERTASELKASAFATLPVSAYATLPPELQAGALETAYQAALLAGRGGDYADGTERIFSCQTCHMRPVVGKGCDKNDAPLRSDLPLHDLMGGNTWMAQVIPYMDARGWLRLGGGLSSGQVSALQEGALRARANLQDAAALSLSGDTLKVINLTGHKLITGYPEGRRMWLNVKWYDQNNLLVREDGAYGPMTVLVGGQPVQVESILDLDDPETRIYEAHFAITQEWAQQLIGLGVPPGLVLAYDRETGQPEETLGALASEPPGHYEETLHFALNNHLAFDNRIPPYGFRYDDARTRNALPVPAGQYGSPGAGGIYRHWDEVELNPPATAVMATIDLLYQVTSWEYVQFLKLANDGSNAFLAEEGNRLLQAWSDTGMAAPELMATTTWMRSEPPPPFHESAPRANRPRSNPAGTVKIRR